MTASPVGDPGDDEPWDEPFDPCTSPPDGDEAWLSNLPAELREEYLVDPWTGDDEKMAAGFLHHAVGRPGVGFAAPPTPARPIPPPAVNFSLPASGHCVARSLFASCGQPTSK